MIIGSCQELLTTTMFKINLKSEENTNEKNHTHISRFLKL